MTVHHLGRSSPAPLLFHKDFWLKKRTDIIDAFVRHAHFYRLVAFVARGRIKIKAIAACVQIGPAILALIRNADLIHYLNFRGAIIAARDQMEFCFDSPRSPFWTRRRFGLPFPVDIHITGLAIFPGHFTP